MRTIIALACVCLSSSSLAEGVRRLRVPERFWGTWALSADLCRDDNSTVFVSGKGYVTAQESCQVQWLVETAGRNGPIYSAHMRCASVVVPERMTALNRLMVPNDRGQLSAGPNFKELKTYHRCPAN